MKSQQWIVIGIVGALAALWWQWPNAVPVAPIRPIDAPVTDVTASVVPLDRDAKPTVNTLAPQQLVKVPSISATEKKPEENADWQRELIDGLIVMGDADSLMAAALMLHELFAGERGELGRVQSLLERAHAQAPGDRAIASVALRVCRSIRSCNAMRYEAVVRNIDARNALGPLVEHLRAIESGTPGDVTAALESLASLRLNLYHAELLQRVARAISATPTTPRNAPDTADLWHLQSELTVRVVEGIEVPSFLSMGPACQAKNWRDRSACERIAKNLSQSELFELQRLGIGMSANASGGRAKSIPDLAEPESYLNWLGSRFAQRPPPAEQWIALLAQHQTEMAAARAWLEQNGVATPAEPRWFKRF